MSEGDQAEEDAATVEAEVAELLKDVKEEEALDLF